MTPALAVIGEIRERNLNWDIVFIGRMHALEGVHIVSEEYRIMTQEHIRFIPLISGKLHRNATIHTLFSLFKIPIGIIQSLWCCLTLKPKVIVSFGGYVALPVVIAGWLLNIPSITHEQTHVLGLTNKIISFFVKKICISFEDSRHAFPSEKHVLTGLPLRKGIFLASKKSPFDLEDRLPLLYVTGGSTGSISLNELIYPIIPILTRHYSVIHQVGRLSIEFANNIQKRLTFNQRKRYLPVAYLDVSEHAWALHHAIVVITRSGANTVGELAILGKVSILIPLPWSAGSEQQENAAMLHAAGSGVVLDQNRLTAQVLAETITRVITKRQIYQKHANEFARTLPRNGAGHMVDEIALLLKK